MAKTFSLDNRELLCLFLFVFRSVYKIEEGLLIFSVSALQSWEHCRGNLIPLTSNADFAGLSSRFLFCLDLEVVVEPSCRMMSQAFSLEPQ